MTVKSKVTRHVGIREGEEGWGVLDSTTQEMQDAESGHTSSKWGESRHAVSTRIKPAFKPSKNVQQDSFVSLVLNF